MNLELSQKLENIESRAALVDFIRNLVEGYGAKGDGWQNRGAEEYLEALSAWLAESDGYYAFRGEPPLADRLDWKHVAEMLLAATVYE